MSIIKTDSQHYQNIAAKIREKTGSSDDYKPRQMPSGVDEVYEAGKKAEHDAFWDSFLSTAGSFIDRFAGDGWNTQTFRPTKNISIVDRNASECFYCNACEVDLVEWCEMLGISITIKPTAVDSMFKYSKFTRLPEMNLSVPTSLNSMFAYNEKLVTIDKLILKDDGTQKWVSTFYSNTALQNITIEGVIGTDFNIQQSPLTPESMISIITHLKDYSGTTDSMKYTVYFSDACWAALDVHSASPTITSWEDYVTSLGWNT